MSLSKSTNTKINSSLLQLSAGDRREIYTIGRDKINTNKKDQLCQKCPLRYCLAFGLALFIIFGIIIAVPLIVVSSSMTTTTTISECLDSFFSFSKTHNP